MNILYNYCWRSAKAIPKWHAYCTKRHGSRKPGIASHSSWISIFKGLAIRSTTHSSVSLAGLAHAQNLSALQLVVFFDVWQGLRTQLGSVKPFFQVFAFGFGGELTLGALIPHDVLLTLSSEMDFLLNCRGWKIEKCFGKKKKRDLNYLNSSSPPCLSYLSIIFTLSVHIWNLEPIFTPNGVTL